MAVRYPEFQAINTEILAISVDSVYSHKVWNEIELTKMVKGGIPYPMLTDVAGNIAKMYDVYDPNLGKSLRATFIIGPEGYIYGMENLTPPVGRNPSEILRQVQAFQNYAATKQLAPCEWHPGDKTLVRDAADVGKVWEKWRLM